MATTPENRSQLYGYADGEKYAGKSMADVFYEIAEGHVWMSDESVSGIGSSQAQTQTIIRELPGVWSRLGVHSLLDAPCGDFNWMRHVDLTGIRYTGGDIVVSLVAQNQQNHHSEKVSFVHLDLMNGPLGTHDLLFCRDCLVHFSFDAIWTTFQTIGNSGIGLVMMTTFPGQDNNQDIITGGWRPLNFEKAPFNLPPPLFVLNERCTEMDGAFADKSLAVWKSEDLIGSRG